MKNLFVGFVLFVASACGGSGGDGPDAPSLEILSPVEGDTFLYGEDVSLLATGLYEVSGDPVDLSGLTWVNSTGDWEASGSDLVVTDLPVGDTVLTASVEVDGRFITDTVAVSIVSEPVDLVGPVDAYVELYAEEYNITIDDDCVGTIRVTVGTDNNLSGSLNCEAFGESVDLGVSGSVADGEVHGAFTVEDSDETVPFDGTYSQEDGMWAEYDSSFSSDDGTLTFTGVFNANVVD